MRHFVLLMALGLVIGNGTLSASATEPSKRPTTAQQQSRVLKAKNDCGATQTTQITPNSFTVASSLNNANNALTIAFQTGNVTYWTAQLSTANVNVMLSANRGNAVVTFRRGLSLQLIANGSAGFNIFLTGVVSDDGTEYSLTGAFLGTFYC
ncbi:hypothetical protein H4S14_000097 [Agrobacterium vitis]|nr:hypothetical protein [Agrobacterium vitis]MBE1436370.1 hypothetical protein [Agrobacterium vitis]